MITPACPRWPGCGPAAEWYEREARDLFGVEFDGNPDAAPLLLYEGFEGFPGRKEFPFYEYGSSSRNGIGSGRPS